MAALACAARVARADDAIERRASALGLRPAMIVAEIGAGSGEAARSVAEWVGASGHVYATEIDPDALAKLRKTLADLPNVTVVDAGVTDTGLPDACCDAIFMEAVYHHFTHPAEVDASIYRALRPGGRLVVIDFPPTIWLAPWTPEGIPANRGGHGIPPAILTQELVAAGFRPVSLDEGWDRGWLGQRYFCAVFEKVASGNTSTQIR